MPSLSATIQRAEAVLDEIISIIRDESESLDPVLSESSRTNLVEEELRLRGRLRETLRSQSKSWSFPSLLGLPSPQAVRCSEDAEELLQRVKDDINAEVRKRATGRGNPPATSFYNFMRTTPESTGPRSADGTSELNAPVQSGTVCSPTNSPFSSSAHLPLDPASASPSTDNVNATVYSAARQAHRRQGSGGSDDYDTRSNCIEINGSCVTGLTMNNGGRKNTGAVIHTTTWPPPPSPHAL